MVKVPVMLLVILRGVIWPIRNTLFGGMMVLLQHLHVPMRRMATTKLRVLGT